MTYKIYTDGSCSYNPGPGGWAGVILKISNTKNIEEITEISGCKKMTTNNEMELFAVIKSLEYLKKIKVKADITVYTDSAYVCNAINLRYIDKWQTNGFKTSKNEPIKNQNLWKRLIDLLQTNVSFQKVKGHSGNKYNERVDTIARNETYKASKLR